MADDWDILNAPGVADSVVRQIGGGAPISYPGPIIAEELGGRLGTIAPPATQPPADFPQPEQGDPRSQPPPEQSFPHVPHVDDSNRNLGAGAIWGEWWDVMRSGETHPPPEDDWLIWGEGYIHPGFPPAPVWRTHRWPWEPVERNRGRAPPPGLMQFRGPMPRTAPPIEIPSPNPWALPPWWPFERVLPRRRTVPGIGPPGSVPLPRNPDVPPMPLPSERNPNPMLPPITPRVFPRLPSPVAPPPFEVAPIPRIDIPMPRIEPTPTLPPATQPTPVQLPVPSAPAAPAPAQPAPQQVIRSQPIVNPLLERLWPLFRRQSRSGTPRVAQPASPIDVPWPEVPDMPELGLELPDLTLPQPLQLSSQQRTKDDDCKCPKPKKKRKQPSTTVATVRPYKRRMSLVSLRNLR